MLGTALGTVGNISFILTTTLQISCPNPHFTCEKSKESNLHKVSLTPKPVHIVLSC